MQIAIAQINSTVGDLKGNYNKIIEYIQKAKKSGADLVVFPELIITGYPPRDLLIKKSFIRKNKEILQQIVDNTNGIDVIVGFVDDVNGDLYNAAALIKDGNLIGIHHKIHLPNYDVFDEKRYFTAGKTSKIYDLHGIKVGLTVCEDIWIENGPVSDLKCEGAELIINISASPYHAGKEQIRRDVIAKMAKDNNVSVVYCNLVGGQDDLIFDGRSYVFNNRGKLVQQSQPFVEELSFISEINTKPEIKITEHIIDDIYKALVLGVRDYFRKNGFKNAIIGLSGGIDSALTAAIAVEALGKENVRGITMPSKFSSHGSVADSLDLAENLGISCDIIPIKDIYNSYISTLEPQFKGTEFNVAEENIQARIRGNILMALSNKFGSLVLATGNKSELSVGYATLYGDMAGGMAVISDVLKMRVYELSRHINNSKGKEIIPESTITKPPSAELREDQKDSDSLPPYEILDPILKAYVEEDMSREEIISLGFSKETVNRIIQLVDRNEYKRQQAALGLRITSRAFGQGRRMPITNKWRGE